MNNYTFDTAFFKTTWDYYPDVYPKFWERLNQFATNAKPLSVNQVKFELLNIYDSHDHLAFWLRKHSKFFSEPSEQEQEIIRELRNDQEMNSLLKITSSLLDRENADPFVIARSMVSKTTLVTGETFFRTKALTTEMKEDYAEYKKNAKERNINFSWTEAMVEVRKKAKMRDEEKGEDRIKYKHGFLNVCEKKNVKIITPEEFYRNNDWKF